MSADGIADAGGVESQIPRPAEANKFGRWAEKLRRGVRWIRRGGVPHEETVAIPVLAFVFYCHAFSASSVPIWVLNTLLVTFNVVCGAWLGLAWTGMPAFKVLLRVIYIAVLGTLGVMLISHEAISRDEAVHTAFLAIQTSGIIFYLSWFVASFFRDALLRQRYLQLIVWYQGIWALALDREDKSKASNLDLAISTIVKNSLKPSELAILCRWLAALFVVLIAYWHFCKWLWLATQ